MLRPNLLSIYKSSAEARLHKQINLSELTAVAYLKDPKGRRNHVFGLFSPSRNFHLQALDEADVRAWVELIKLESRIDEEEQGFLLASPIDVGVSGRETIQKDQKDSWDEDRLRSSSPEPPETLTRPRVGAPDGVSIRRLRKPSASEMHYSGDDLGGPSDLSDAAFPSSIPKPISGVAHHRKVPSISNPDSAPLPGGSAQLFRSGTEPNGSQMSVLHMDQNDARVIRHGYLLCLKSKGGVRQWKRHWVVLRSQNLAFYKSEDVSGCLLRFGFGTCRNFNGDDRSMLLI